MLDASHYFHDLDLWLTHGLLAVLSAVVVGLVDNYLYSLSLV